MFKRKLSIMGIMVLIFAILGCSRTASTHPDIKENNAPNTVPNSAVQKVAEHIKIRGDFRRSFEIYELEANGTLYYVSDPKQLLMTAAEKIGQRHYFKSFTTCVVGIVSSEGRYGPNSKYQLQITVHNLCV